ncbi:MAG: Fic family protein, partial [Clostridia bacterium]|nr:Fic family protein [Clostridia bacterium]
ENGLMNVDDILETVNHFKCIDLIIAQAKRPVSEKLIKQLHFTLKNGTRDSRQDWFALGDYKRLPNEVGGRDTVPPEKVSSQMKKLLASYQAKSQKTLPEIIAFHYEFEIIHPFQDGNGRVGRLIMFKECLRNNIVPFIISDSMKLYYYRGLGEWKSEKGFLLDTCLAAQDQFKRYLDYFRIPYKPCP